MVRLLIKFLKKYFHEPPQIDRVDVLAGREKIGAFDFIDLENYCRFLRKRILVLEFLICLMLIVLLILTLI